MHLVCLMLRKIAKMVFLAAMVIAVTVTGSLFLRDNLVAVQATSVMHH